MLFVSVVGLLVNQARYDAHSMCSENKVERLANEALLTLSLSLSLRLYFVFRFADIASLYVFVVVSIRGNDMNWNRI